MTFRFILIFSLLFQTFGTWAQDSIPANTRTRIYFSPTESFVSQIYDNPAINYYAHTFSISELQIGWEQQNANKAFLPQLSKNHWSLKLICLPLILLLQTKTRATFH